ncbi:uncharacterized protein LOC134269841 [Saccostrea cucullata]|uniref:uncharacterized protein LOC134269841 n=1 Tax=Saccostrea cuccullata TaxID=36930 RepID=UPI002ED02357
MSLLIETNSSLDTRYRYRTRASYSLRRRCCYGYTGSYCDNPICSCQNGGICIAPNVCSCPAGYAGILCQRPICHPACQHGHCVSPDRCSCNFGYTGAACSQPICNPPCQSGGTCVSINTCQCQSNQAGPQCNQPLCNPACLNGGVCSSGHVCDCSGTHFTGSRCEIPVCNPACRNGGTCVSPNICDCPETYRGAYCEIPLCSYHDPCFPGVCSAMLNCRCTHGFSGEGGFERCKTFDANNIPIITKCTSVLRNIERTGKKREMYQFVTDSSEPNSMKTDMLWLNQKGFNYLNVEITAMYVPADEISTPAYVKDFAFGIVAAYLEIDLYKVHKDSSDIVFVSLNSTTYPCPNQPGSLRPNEALYSCNIIHHDFDRLLEDGDNLTLTVIVQNGGYRALKTSSSTNYIDLFKGRNSSKSMMYRFDFRKPHHCNLDSNKCSVKAFTVQNDITKDPIQISWEGWSDALSGIEKYMIEIYPLKPNQNVNPSLTEPDPWSPSHVLTFNTSQRGCTYIPQKQGMFSLILNVVDRANNTEYARMLVLYDNTSSITIDHSSPMISTSAVAETNYQWQNNLTNDISISWKGHFRNKFHEDKKLLSQVTDFRHFDHDKKFQKKVLNEFDDNDGERTLNAIQNVHGILKFEYAYGNANQGNQTPLILQPVNDLTQTLSFFVQRRNGDTLNIWIRATDSMGNRVTDIMHVYFDETPPTALSSRTVRFIPNINQSIYPFSSRLRIDAHDRESGIFRIDWQFISNHSRIIFKKGSIPGNKTKNLPQFGDGYKVPMGDFFLYSHYLDVDNCWMVVPKESFYNEFLKIKVKVYNRAMESTGFEMTLIHLDSLHGIDEYTGPINLYVDKKYDNSVRLRWTLSPTCYERTRISLSAYSENGEQFSRVVDKDADHFDLTGLASETTYNLSFVTEYGDEKSNPIFLVFKTSLPKTSAALTGGQIAGISTPIVIIFLVGIIVVVFIFWKKRKCTNKQTMPKRIVQGNVLYNREFNDPVANDTHQQEEQPQRISHTTITFGPLIKQGNFADIYEISRAQRTLVAKVMKKGYTSTDEVLMQAKIDYYLYVGKHENILRFVGAVLNDKIRGKYIVLEYCNKGQLDIWLQNERNKADDRTFNKLYKIANGICDGMVYLEEKEVVHQRLGTRNVLLNESATSGSELIPKIYGFCPTPKTDTDGKEQIHFKSVAPECFENPPVVTTKSDVWSFGIVLWEIFSLGEDPYPNKTKEEVWECLQNGERPKRPQYDKYYNVMTMCWHQDADTRPSFIEINHMLNDNNQYQ